MSKLIRDIVPRVNKQGQLRDAVEEERAAQQWELSKVNTVVLVAELYARGVDMKRIFAQYYAMEEAGNARTMDVEDARLAGLGGV